VALGGIILAGMVGGVVVVAISFVLTLLKEMAAALIRFIADVTWREEPAYDHVAPAATDRAFLALAKVEDAPASSRPPIERAAFFPPGYIEPILEPVGSLPDPMIEVSHHDRLLVLARAYVAYRHGTAYRPQTHKESVISISALLDQIFIPVDGGYELASDAAIEAGYTAFRFAYGHEEEGSTRPAKALPPPAQQALASATSGARL
jgi:hypothetical protein